MPAAVLFALAEHEGRRSRDSLERNAFWLMQHLEKGEALEAILKPVVLARMGELEG
ncbi:hypothetical protein [Xanthobacter sediminis]